MTSAEPVSLDSVWDRLGLEGDDREHASKFFADRGITFVGPATAHMIVCEVASIHDGRQSRDLFVQALAAQLDIDNSPELEDAVDAMLRGHCDDE